VSKNRLEAFSDGVFAIILTIMVLELKVPHDTSIEALCGMVPTFISYILSYVFIGIYWVNHHHLMHVVQKVSGPVLWANLHLLFWLTFIPFVTGWMGEHSFHSIPIAAYGVVLMGAAIAYYILTLTLLKVHEAHSPLAKALGRDFKGKISVVIYAIAIPLAFYLPIAAYALYALVAAMWLIPDRRMEKVT
jgi:uncharacterized membrane protein